jgi:hypothetical protein
MTMKSSKSKNPKSRKPAGRICVALVWCFLAIGFPAFGCGWLHAAEPGVREPVKFTALAWDVFDPDNDLTLNYTLNGKPVPLTISWRDRSPPMVCDGPGTLVFSRTVQRDGKPVEVPVATAIIPEGMTRVLLVFGRNPKAAAGEPRIRVMVVDDSYAVFPGQSARFLNYSQVELGGSLGGQSFVVPPGGDTVVPATMPEANRLLAFRLARRDTAGAWKKLRSTGLPMSAGLRTLVFLTEDPSRPDRPEMTLIRDVVEPPPAPERRN